MDQIQSPSLTVAIPTYNRSSSLSPLLHALAAQAAPGDELLVLDDASNDNIAEAVGAFPRFRLVRHVRNLGMVGNWNACLHEARRDWICIVHHDDDVAPGALQSLRRACALANGPALVVHWRDHPELGDHFRCRLSEAGSWAVLNVPTIPSGAVVHRRIIEESGVFDPRWKYSADLEYFPRVCARFPLVIIESPDVVRYRLHKTNYQYETWRKPDFEEQLQDIQRLVLSYANLPEDSMAQRFEERMAAMYCHMFANAHRIGDRQLLRRVGRRLVAGRTNGRKLRLQAGIAAILGWYPKLRQQSTAAGGFEVSDL